MCMTSYALHVTSLPQFSTTHHFMYEIWSALSDITSSVPLSSHPPYQWYHRDYMYDLISSISGSSHPLYLWHNIHWVWHHNTLCWWRNTRHMYDMLCTADDNAPTLSHQTTVFTVFASTSGMITQPLYQTSNPLYLCHQTVSVDISPTFVWHHTHLLFDFIWTIYNITPDPHVITLLYLWHHRLYIWNHIQYEGNIYMWHHSHYLGHHTHSIGNITPTLCMTSHSA